MPTATLPAPTLLQRLRWWLNTPLVFRLLLLLGLALLAYGYSEVWAPQGSLEQVTLQVLLGLLAVAGGAALLVALLFLRTRGAF